MVSGTRVNNKPVPGPKGLPLVGVIPQLMRNPLELLEQATAEYGDIIRLSVGPKSIYVLRHPSFFRDVLFDREDSFSKGSINKILASVGGNSLISAEGEFWKRQRRLVQPAFHRKRLAILSSYMTDAISKMCDRWEEKAERGEPIDMIPEMSSITRDIIIATILGGDLGKRGDEVEKAVDILMEVLGKRIWTFALPSWIPLPGKKEFEESLKLLDDTIYGLIAKQKEIGPDKGAENLLNMLLNMRDEDGNGMDDKQMRDEIVTFFIAGYETSTLALAWTWYFLSQNPQYFNTLFNEVDSVLADRTPTMEDLNTLVYSRMVFQEALRARSPSWMIPRETVEDIQLGEYLIPAKSVVILSQYLMHRHPEFWEDPDTYNPERFRPEANNPSIKTAYMPFGGGPRQCIGINFATMEAQFIIAMVAQRFQLDLVDDAPIQPVMKATIHPSRPIEMRLKRRLRERSVGS